MEDHAIIELYWARNEEAIAASQEKYGKLCHNLAQQIVQSHEDAEECVNDTWVRAWGAMPPQRPNYLRAFFAKITRNLALSRWESQHAQKRGSGAVALALEELSECVTTGQSAEDEVMAGETGERINAFLCALPRRSCDIFLRRYFYLESMDEIAGQMHMSVGAVRMNLSRSRQKLRSFLEEESYG